MSLFHWLLWLVLVVWIYWLWTRRKFYALALKIPGPRGFPLLGIGHILLRREDLLKRIETYCDEFSPNGDVHTGLTWLGPYPTLLTCDPNIIEDIFTSPHCVNKSFVYAAVNDTIGNGLFSSNDPHWSVHRRHLNRAFSHKVLLSFFPVFNEEDNNLVKTFEDLADKSEAIDVITILQHFTLDIATKTTMDKSATQDARESRRNLLRSYHCAIESVTEMAFFPWYRIVLLRKLIGIYEPFNSAKAEIRQFIRSLIDEKLGNLDIRSPTAVDGAKNTFIDHAIDLMRRGIFSGQDVEEEANAIVVGAFETTATTIGHVLILLAMFPEYQQRVFDELVSIFPDGGEFEVSYANTQDMVYMDMVLNESMRAIAPVPFVGRENSQEVLLSNGIVLPAGVQLVVDIFRLHRRVDIWGPEAHLFNPDNFLPANLNGKHPYAFIPFTKGIRNCIGWKYGLLSTKVTLAKLLRNYKFSTDFQYKDLEFVEAVVVKFKQTPLLRIHKREL